MAFDKVVDSAFLEAGLKKVGDSIRAKAGTSELLEFPDAMSAAVDAIDTSENLDDALDEQESLIDQIQAALEGKAGASVETCTLTMTGIAYVSTAFCTVVQDGVIGVTVRYTTGAISGVVKDSLLVLFVNTDYEPHLSGNYTLVSQTDYFYSDDGYYYCYLYQIHSDVTIDYRYS